MKTRIQPPHISQQEREHIKQSLVATWKRGRETSGRVWVESLSFSKNPAQWKIIAEVCTGSAYDPGVMRRADVKLHAVLSYDFTEPTSIHLIPNLFQTTGKNWRGNYEIIAGIHDLTPPAGIDRLELITCSQTIGTRAMKTQRIFRFTAGGFTAITPLQVQLHSQARLAARLAHKQFNQLIAERVAERLTPKSNFLHQFATTPPR